MPHNILSFGEVLWDIFPDSKKPGGSPANVAYHLHSLGNETKLLSRVGTDDDGEKLIEFLNEKGLSTEFVQQDESLPTGKVTVHFKADEPSYIIHEPSAWDAIEATDEVIKHAGELDAICYASLSQRSYSSAKALQALLKSLKEDCLTVFDLNLRPPFINSDKVLDTIEQSRVVKFNEQEFEEAKSWYGRNEFATELLNRDPEKILLITRGENGSSMISKTGTYTEPAYPISGDGDFVGVGDAFLAAFTHLKLNGTAENQILKHANRYAAAVASKKGAMPELPEELLKSLQS
jgi:fructokinase